MARRRSGGFDVDVDFGEVDDVFKTARKRVRRQAKVGMKRAGDAVVLPRVRAAAATEAPTSAVSVLTVKATQSEAVVTTRGPKMQDRILGLLNFGGVVTTKIEPTKAKALTIGSTGEMRASVTAPRSYDGKHRIEEGVAASVDRFEAILLESVIQAFDPIPHTP